MTFHCVRALALAGACFVLTTPALNAQPSTATSDWIRRNAIPIVDVDSWSNFDDLQPLKAVIGDAQIVALGEGTHGTHEFFAMKRRLTEFLAREMGFTVFAMEANFPEAAVVGDYVRTGRGDAASVVKGLRIWPWTTEELTDLVRWMRGYVDKGGKMQFAGFDMQLPGAAQQNVVRLLQRANPELARFADSSYQRIASRTGSAPLSTAQAEQLARDVSKRIEASTAQLETILPPDSVAWIVQNAQVALQGYQWRNDPSRLSREVSMAENVKWLLSRVPRGTRIVLWAHNAHLSRESFALGGQVEERFHGRMFNVAFTAGSGTFTAEESNGAPNVFNLLEPPPDSFEHTFRATGIPQFMLDLRRASAANDRSSNAATDNSARGAAASQWLTERRPFRYIGISGADRQFRPTYLTRFFDAIVYFDRSRASQLLR